MSTATERAEVVEEGAITAAIAGAKMAGFDVTDKHRDRLEAFARGEFTVDEYVERVRVENQAAAQE